MFVTVHHACQSLRRSPGFSCLITLNLAIGLGLTTAFYSIASAALFAPLPFHAAERIVRISEDPAGAMPMLLSRLDAIERLSNVFSDVGALAPQRVQVTDGVVIRPVRQIAVSKGYLSTMGISTLVGRPFEPADFDGRGSDTVMLSEELWRAMFGARPEVVGTQITISGVRRTILGVLPLGMVGGGGVVIPLPISPGASRGSVFARLNNGVSLESARRALNAAAKTDADLERWDDGPYLTSVTASVAQPRKQVMHILIACAALVLCGVCFNVTSLFLNRGLQQRNHLQIRLALGASAGRVFAHCFAEVVVLCLLGGFFGTLIAVIAVPGISAVLPFSLSSGVNAHVDQQVLVVAGLLSMLVALVVGVMPSSTATRNADMSELLAGTRATASKAVSRIQLWAVGAQSLIAVVLVALSGMFALSLARLQAIDLGFDLRGSTLLSVVPVDTAQADRFYREIVSALKSEPGVTAVGAIDHAPLVGGYSRIDGESVRALDGGSSDIPRAGWDVRNVIADYFSASGTPIISGVGTLGRLSEEHRGVVLSSNAARALFGTAPAVGRNISLRAQPYQVVGVAGQTLPSGPTSVSPAQIYVLEARIAGAMTIVVRHSGSDDVLAQALQRAVSITGGLAVQSPSVSGGSLMATLTEPAENRMALFVMLGACSVLVVMFGMATTTAQHVLRRRQELRLKTALGATPARLRAEGLRREMTPMFFGAAVGVIAVAASGSILEPLLFATRSTDPFGLGIAFSSVIVVGIVSSWLQLWRFGDESGL